MRAEELRVVSSNGEPSGEVVVPSQRNCAIEINNASLHYPIGPFVRGSLKANMLKLFGHREQTVAPVYVDAIRNMSLTVNFGERVGVIGSNGSGKSTLLRAIAGIYPLKAGSINVVGNIGTLLEIGLGFESESTGRENIYYRGMSMGVSRRELKLVEQQIVDFADLGDFIDLPVRTYSSGMYVRLAFAISTQFSPDVLLIDEVFGAGDASFSQRAEKRMQEIVRVSGIVILATHDTGLIERMCTRVLWLNRGVVVRDGPPVAVLPQYRQFMDGQLEI